MVTQPLSGGPKMGAEKLIIRSEKVRFVDILSLLLLRRPITSYRFVEAGDQTAADFGSTPGDWFVALTEVIQKALAGAYYPALYIGAFVEFLLNFIALNNGILGIIWNIFRCKLVIPLNREAPNFRTMIGLIDGRTELKPLPAGGGPDDRRLQVVGVSGGKAADEEYFVDVENGECGSAAVPLVQQQYMNGRLIRLRTYSVFEVTIMAAKIAYENAAYIENVVNNVWKFNFVGVLQLLEQVRRRPHDAGVRDDGPGVGRERGGGVVPRHGALQHARLVHRREPLVAGHGRHGPRPCRLPQGARPPGGGRQGRHPRLPPDRPQRRRRQARRLL
uniref:Uncharacterized protein n=1 Tax=Arundo donax TaxID=35708 RepID=A0A0A9D8Q5_ARUDO